MRKETWTHIGLRKESMMYSEEQRIKALHVFHQTGSVTDVVRRLGYRRHKGEVPATDSASKNETVKE